MTNSKIVWPILAVVLINLFINAIAQPAAPAVPAATCDKNCPCTFTPVCGSDRITYSSECTLKAANCDRAEPVTVASTGVCVRRRGPGRGGPGGRWGGRGEGRETTAATEA